MATTVRQPVDPNVVRKFHFTREMIEGPVYRKYEKAIRKVWSVEDLDFTQDAKDWNRIEDEQKRGLLGVTVRFLAGEQNVTDELVPLLAASHALNRFDWTVYLSTFLMEEAKHAEFFMRWHDRVPSPGRPRSHTSRTRRASPAKDGTVSSVSMRRAS